MPAELLRFADGALRDDDVDEGGAAVVHRLVEGAANVLRVLDKEALAAGACPGGGRGLPRRGPGASIIRP